jgi:hypothetical protein
MASAGFAAHKDTGPAAARQVPSPVRSDEGKAAEAKLDAMKAEAAKVEKLTGSIVSIDSAKLEITVKDDATQADRVVKVTKSQLKGLKAGQKVTIELKAGTSEAAKLTCGK